jgi:hypothetical protein
MAHEEGGRSRRRKVATSGESTHEEGNDGLSPKHIYLGLIALIQTLALSELVRGLDALASPNVVYRLEFLSDVQMIVLIWHEYMMNMSNTPGWMLGPLDSYIPFLLGICEVGVVHATLDRAWPAWCVWMAGVTIVGILAYLNLYTRSRRDPLLRPTPRALQRFRGMNFVFPFLGTAYYLFVRKVGNHQVAVLLISNLYWVGFLARSVVMWRGRRARASS